MSLTLSSDGQSSTFDSGAVTIVAGDWVQVGVVTLGRRKGFVALVLSIAVASVTNLKITRSLLTGGHDDLLHQDLAVNTDLNTRTEDIPSLVPTLAFPIALGTQIDIKLLADGVREFGVYAKSAGTATVRMRGNLPGQ